MTQTNQSAQQQKVTGRDLYKSAGLDPAYVEHQINGLLREWQQAMTNTDGFYSQAYVEEKLRKVREGFEEISIERERQERLKALGLEGC